MINIKCGDCLELMNEIPDNSVDCIITDPPYCVGITSNGIKSTFSDFYLTKPFWEQIFREWSRISKDDINIYMFTDWRTYPFIYPIFYKYFIVRNLIVWEHGLLRPGNWYRGSHELIIFATKGKSKRKFGGGEKDIIRIKPESSELHPNRVHPSQKPVKLLEKIILNSTDKGEIVLDNTMGSGSTGVACVNTKRSFIGYEIDEKYFDIAKGRIAQAQLKR